MTHNFHYPIPKTAPAISAMVNIPMGEIDAGIAGMVAGGAAYPFMRSLLTTSGAKTLATDALDVANLSFVTVTSETGTADNLSTLTNPVAGATYIIQAAAGHTITVKHGVGNIFLNGAADFIVTGNIQLALFYSPLGIATDLDITAATPSSNMIARRTVVGSPVANVTISSIPATYSHLLLILEIRSSKAATLDSVTITFNADVAANYYSQYITINAATLTTTETLAVNSIFLTNGMPASTASAGNGHIVMWITNYASTTMRKVVQYSDYGHISNASGGLQSYIGAGDWANTANAISSITFSSSGASNIVANSAYELYGFN